MQNIRDIDPGKIRAKKKGWMYEETWNFAICFIDHQAISMPVHSTLPPYKAERLNYGVNPSHEANGPNNGHHDAVI